MLNFVSMELKLKILIVDDEPDMGFPLDELLTEEGHHVDSAYNSQDAPSGWDIYL